MFTRSLAILAAAAAMTAGSAAARPIDPTALETGLQALPRASALYVTGSGVERAFGVSSGEARPGEPMTADTPLRIASNTKTFTAAAVLRLWETGRIDLDAPIGPLLSPALDARLREDEFDTGLITVRHLMSHSAGLYDHGGDRRFVQAILTDPTHEYSREELVALSMEWADPQSAPGTKWQYSDTGYILLGDIVERIAGKPLGPAVRELLRLDQLDLNATWWEIMEPRPKGAAEQAPQALGDFDAATVHASMDLYGGGGLVMSARDLAVFFAALFEGRVFDRAETLEEMLWQGPHARGDHYRLGVFVTQAEDGRVFYWHSGFWGTIVVWDPQRRLAVAGVTVNQDNAGQTRKLIEAALDAPPLVP